MGAAISPFNAFLILQGIETLALRMDRICENSLKIAQFLQKHPKVSWVNYAGLPDHKDHALVQKYMGGRASGILNFGVKGGAKAAASSRMRCNWSPAWSTSATARRWPATRHRPRTASCRRKS
jgi:O-acetylhomoserine/O-acetylserine sulfhydrylase-like pyridoxal-dependent enzyme